MHFLEIFRQKRCLFGSKRVFLWQEVHYYMVYIAYFTELDLQICDYAQKQRICRENCNYALDENFHDHFCPRRKAAKFCHPGPGVSKLPSWIWLSATEGDGGLKLGELDHWPKGVRAKEGVWRDYYTGEELDNYRKPWMYTNKDDYWGEGHNCLLFLSTMPKTRQCYGYPRACPCTYKTPPLIHLRGFCPHTLLDKKRYTVTQSAGNPSNIIVVGYQSA